MFKIFLKTNAECSSMLNANFLDNKNTKEMPDISIMYSGLVSNVTDYDKENKAFSLGYKSTECADIYYDEKTKSYYRWNPEDNQFEKFDPKAKMNAYYSQKADGQIDNFGQGVNAGNCWLLSAIYGLSSTEEGREVLKDVIKTDENGNVTVNLKGVGKQYTFTNEELNTVIKDDAYSYLSGDLYTTYYSMGDKDVLALELATRNYRKEIDESGRAKNNSYSYSYIEFSGAMNMYNYSGTQSAALGLITGKKVNVIRSGIDDNTIIKDGMIYMQRLDENYLKPIFDNKDNIVLVSLKNVRSDGHAYTFKSYDDEYIYLVNPYDTSKMN